MLITVTTTDPASRRGKRKRYSKSFIVLPMCASGSPEPVSVSASRARSSNRKVAKCCSNLPRSAAARASLSRSRSHLRPSATALG